MQITRFERATLEPAPWKNAGGSTREVIRRPAAATLDSIDWRVSIARVDADGPFSAFAGIDRVIVLLDGAGIRLQSPDGDVDYLLDTLLTPFGFDGEAAITGSLVSGTSHDFNVMTRRATLRAEVCVVRLPRVLSASSRGVLFAARGTWKVRGAEGDIELSTDAEHTLDPDTGLWWEGSSIAWQLSPATPSTSAPADAALIAVQIYPRA